MNFKKNLKLKLNTPQPRKATDPLGKAIRLTHLCFERPDLPRTIQFLEDFGLKVHLQTENEVFFRGQSSQGYCYHVKKGTSAKFVGFGFEVARFEELERLSKIPGAGSIGPSSKPGGGQTLTLVDTAGFQVEVLFDPKNLEEVSGREPMEWNVGGQVRRVNETQRSPMAPAEILKLGHLVLEVADFQGMCDWYTKNFGLIPSDVQVLPDGTPAVVFMRLDLGGQPADHHTLAVAQSFASAYSHSAFEVVDPDAVGMGNKFLEKRGWKHVWGIGRHILGSQIFDYWQDPWGDKHEHYCDGDLFTNDKPMEIHPFGKNAMSQWGPVMPQSFVMPKVSLDSIKQLIVNLFRFPGFGKRLLSLIKHKDLDVNRKEV